MKLNTKVFRCQTAINAPLHQHCGRRRPCFASFPGVLWRINNKLVVCSVEGVKWPTEAAELAMMIASYSTSILTANPTATVWGNYYYNVILHTPYYVYVCMHCGGGRGSQGGAGRPLIGELAVLFQAPPVHMWKRLGHSVWLSTIDVWMEECCL